MTDTGETTAGPRLGTPGRKPALQVAVLRALTAEDLPGLAAGLTQASKLPPTNLQSLRHSHHQLARLVAQGMRPAEASLMTGYSPSYIARLIDDPTFAELLAYYSNQKDMIFVELLERMRTQGLSALDELQKRLEDAPESWTKRELMEYFRLLAVDGPRGQGSARFGAGAGAAGAGVAINVTFVGAGDGAVATGRGAVIDVEAS